MPELDDGATKLRSGTSVWQAAPRKPAGFACVSPQAGMRLKADAVIVGAGITGAFAAERLTREGRSVVVIDRRRPASGSTTASTAMLQWELDASLLELEDALGFEAAAMICGDGMRAVKAIGELDERFGLDCGYRRARSVMLAGTSLDPADLKEEKRLRELAGAETRYLDAGELAKRGLAGEAGLESWGAAANPVALTEGLLRVAWERGAIILSPATAHAYEHLASGVCVHVAEGATVSARTLVLANGYELPEFVHAPLHSIVSSWALATEPRETPVGDGELVWEAADPYLYFRPGPGGRVIAGGEDVDTDDVERRDALTGEKARAILAKLGARMPALLGVEAEFAWAGFFGETEDSLPLIGPAPGHADAWAAFGYGGNGIAFSQIAAEMLAERLAGQRRATADFYALDRPG